MNSKLLNDVTALAVEAGLAIMKVYEQDVFEVEQKADDSPVTAADLAAHRVLQAGLEKMIDGVPVLSEEAVIPDFSLRRQWRKYWMIDPLDGTKEFINRNGEFTVNIALIENHVPVMGVVHVPVSGLTYMGDSEQGALRQDKNGHRVAITVRSMTGRGDTDRPISVVASRRHGAEVVSDLLTKLGDSLGSVETCNMGSSLKLCMVAEGQADIYPRLAPTMEWDTAAAQAVVEAAGGIVLKSDFEALRYNTKEDLLNPHFYVIGDQSFPWREMLDQD
jgi:3'(2'), 5'-bisphosphate nucleotidase